MYIKHKNQLINLDNVVKISQVGHRIVITPNHSDPEISLIFPLQSIAETILFELCEFLNNPSPKKNVFNIELHYDEE